MIRNLKVLILAALALSALGAISASAAQAATFKTPVGGETTLTDLKDGTGKTAHQVFEIGNAAGTEKVSLTCSESEGDGTVSGTSTEDVTLVTIAFTGCISSGQTVTVTNTGCNFTFTPASPQLHIVSEAGKECKHGKNPIEAEFRLGTAVCRIEVGEQTVSGIVYHNLPDGTVTVEETNIGGFVYNATGELCPYGTTSNGVFVTDSAIVTGEKKGTTEMVTVEWTKEA